MWSSRLLAASLIPRRDLLPPPKRPGSSMQVSWWLAILAPPFSGLPRGGVWAWNSLLRRPCGSTAGSTRGYYHTAPSSSSLLAAAASSSSSPSPPGSSESSASSSLPSSSFTVWFDSTNHWHRDSQYHPEQPRRISACLEAIDDARLRHHHHHHHQEGTDGSSRSKNHDQDEHPKPSKSPLLRSGLVQLVDVAPSEYFDPTIPLEGSDRVLSDIQHQPFTEEELQHARKALIHIHGAELVQQLESRCYEARQKRLHDHKSALGFLGRIDEDTYVTTESFGVALRAAAAWIRATDMATAIPLTQGGHRRSSSSMALVRPPGHHATARSQNGFCLYNNAAAAAWHIVSQHPNRRVSILDWDVHYGQGVADIVQHFHQVRYASIHQTPAFPYLGETLEVTGVHRNVLTIPIRPSTTWCTFVKRKRMSENSGNGAMPLAHTHTNRCHFSRFSLPATGYKEALDQALAFCSQPGEWEPDVVIVSAGFDALDSDELASVSLQASDFGRMARALRHHLNTNHPNKVPSIVLGLEGGYQLTENAAGGNLQLAVVETIHALLDDSTQQTKHVASASASERLQ